MFNARIPAILNRYFGRTAANTVKPRNDNPLVLTQAELQQISAVLKMQTEALQDCVKDAKKDSSVWWNLSNKEDASTAPYFGMFSKSNRERKRLQAMLRKVETLQGKVKRILRA